MNLVLASRIRRSLVPLFPLALVLVACPPSDADSGDETGSSASTSSLDTSTGAFASDSSSDAVDESSGGSADTTGNGACAGDGQRPSPRGELDGVWDAARGRMVLFGGDHGFPVGCMSQTEFASETWAFRTDCDEFDAIDGGLAPSPRGRYALAHDIAGQRMVLHGGRFRDGTSGSYTLHDDTWVFDLATDTWTELSPTGPSARSNHTAVVSGNQLLVFGGNSSSDGGQFVPLADLWALDLQGGQWQQLAPNDGPSARLFHASTIAAGGATMYVYGGGDENAFLGPFFADLWAYDVATNAWSLLDDGRGGPVASIWGDLLYDADGDRLLLWGAHEDNLLGNNNKIWSFDLDGGGWSMLEEGDVQLVDPKGFCEFPVDFVEPDLNAPERRNAGAAVLTDTGELLVFGGKTDCGIIDDVWGWSLSDQTWTSRVRATAGEICVRAFAEGCSTMCF